VTEEGGCLTEGEVFWLMKLKANVQRGLYCVEGRSGCLLLRGLDGDG
jgi:hypothetical protein